MVVNYPIKEVLIDMFDCGDFTLDSEMHKFCVPWFTIQVASIGTEMFVAAWNNHPISGKIYLLSYNTSHEKVGLNPVTRHGQQHGVPIISMRNNNKARPTGPSVVPSVTDAVHMYQQMGGGHLQDPHQVRRDPLCPAKQELCKVAFCGSYPSFETIFSSLVNGDTTMFRNALKFFIDVTFRLSFS